MQYHEALAWLYGRQSLGIKLGLDKVTRLLDALDNPQQFPVIHIAGTNGKGSVARFLHQILTCAGFRVGLTTSPHLHQFTERIKVVEDISKAEVVALVTRLQPICDALDRAGDAPTFFELVCAMAWLHFHEQQVDIAVVETGLGGRLDATNVLASTLTIITNIGLDHEQFLGPDHASIAFEKAGIMKPGIPLVTAAKGEALQIIKAQSHALQLPMSVVGEDYDYIDCDGLTMTSPHGTRHFESSTSLAENVVVSVAAIDALRQQGWNISENAVQAGLAQTRHPGRMERIGEHLLDCAHNVEGAHALRRQLAALDWAGFDLIVGMANDKNWQEMLQQWVPLARHVHAVRLPNSRSINPQEIADYCQRFGIPASTYDHPADALAHVERAVIAGSIFMVAPIRAALLGIEEDPIGDQ